MNKQYNKKFSGSLGLSILSDEEKKLKPFSEGTNNKRLYWDHRIQQTLQSTWP